MPPRVGGSHSFLCMQVAGEGAGDGVSRITDEVAVSGLMVNHARRGVPERALSSNKVKLSCMEIAHIYISLHDSYKIRT